MGGCWGGCKAAASTRQSRWTKMSSCTCDQGRRVLGWSAVVRDVGACAGGSWLHVCLARVGLHALLHAWVYTGAVGEMAPGGRVAPSGGVVGGRMSPCFSDAWEVVCGFRWIGLARYRVSVGVSFVFVSHVCLSRWSVNRKLEWWPLRA